MPLLLLLPLLVAALFALYVVLLPLTIVLRYRRGRARRRVLPWGVALNAWLLVASTLVYLAFAAVLGQWVDNAFPDAATGVAIGAAVGLLGLRLDRFELTSEGLYRTPNRALLLALTLLLAARIVLGLWLAWHEVGGQGASAWISRGGLFGIGGVLLGYALATAWGLRHRVRRVAARR